MTIRQTTTLAAAALLSLLACLAGCPGPQSTPERSLRATGTLALSEDGRRLYVANPDQDTVSVVDTERRARIAEIPVGRYPVRLALAEDGRLFVANRGSRSVSVVDTGSLTVVRELAVGAEPTGLALSGDGDALFVACQESGTVTAIDLATYAPRWTQAVGAHPRAVAAFGDRLLVTHFKTGAVSVLDAGSGEPQRDLSLTQPAAVTQSAFRSVFDPGQARDLAVAADGRVYVAHTQARAVAIEVENGTGYGGDPSSTLVVPAVAAGLSTVDGATLEVLEEPAAELDDFGFGQPADADRPPMVVASDGGTVFNVPSAILPDPDGRWLYVAFEGSNNVAVISTTRRRDPAFPFPGVYAVVDTAGEFPTGLALAPSGDRLYVHNAHSYTVSIVERSPEARFPRERLVVTDVLRVADDPEWLTPDLAEGRRLFFSAVDSSMTDARAGGISCASCHPEGRDDGRTWLLEEGPRNTPMLATGFLSRTAPFHWAGEIQTFHDFQEIVTRRMGGTGLSGREFDQMLAFLESPGILQPDNPNRRPEGLTPAQMRGRDLYFGKAGCVGCHAGETTTDNLNHDVGTFRSLVDPHTGRVVEDMRPDLQTPTLRHIYTSAPYLHTGEARTLRERLVDFAGDGPEAHGAVETLTEEELDDLVAYLKTL